ncbi:hypothetical protein BCD67_17860 [Oscillatoriales cyanobacterium USR001]|nr:hypothetical protein BCD67_17860 [Oscillatoriales cyanobacterium USR001]
MNSATVKIYEFSTGIQAERTPDGWVSRGFTGEYMNKTIDPIPVAIQSAIANREFAVAEGASSDEPAIIGREVRSGGEVWSAIAVVTRGRDDRGRSASMYRYFFCEGLGNLWKILAWMEPLRKAGRMPIFNPFETKIVGQPNQYQVNNQPAIPLKTELQYLLINNEAPIIISSGQPCTASIINEMAAAKANENGQPVAWAYKAEALEQPRSFQVIQPASEKAEQLLRRAIASTPQYTAPIAGEYELKSAIKGLISRDKVKLDQVQAIETAINQIQDNDWEAIFNGQGASQALKQGIYSPQMVRLLTLRAIVIPERLPEFLDWMQKRGKQEDHYQVSDIFQSEIKNSIREILGNEPKFILKVTQGVRLIIPNLVYQPGLLYSVVWLLSSPSGFWQHIYSRQVAGDIDHDLSLINQRVKYPSNSKSQILNNDESWRILSSELQIYWQQRSYPHQERYQPLADLFGELGNPRIAAFFYHVAYGEVPKNIFIKISNQGGLHSTVYGITIKRKVPLTEILGVLIQEFFAVTLPIGEIDMPLWFALFILLIFTSSGFGVGLMVGSSGNQQTTKKDDPAQKEKEPGSSTHSVNPLSTKKPDLPPVSITKNQIPKKIEDEALGKFADTIRVIDEEVVKELQEELVLDKIDIINELKSLLKVENYADAKNGNNELTKRQWIEAIYEYQRMKYYNIKGSYEGNKADGVIETKKPTVDNLKKDLRDRLQKKEQPSPTSSSGNRF